MTAPPWRTYKLMKPLKTPFFILFNQKVEMFPSIKNVVGGVVNTKPILD
jgi:hypothetical protein